MNQTVYIVTEGDWDADVAKSVWTTRQAAIDEAERLEAHRQKQGGIFSERRHSPFYVEPFYLNTNEDNPVGDWRLASSEVKGASGA